MPITLARMTPARAMRAPSDRTRRPAGVSSDRASFVTTAPDAFNTLNSQSSVIVRVRGPLVKRDRTRDAALPRAVEFPETGSGEYRASPSLPNSSPAMSRRGVRRFNVGAARAHSALRPYHAASLLP
ncbi:hypothetical protein [Burkholderia plantarii]|uniref:Uncharacterized protein n=1 Tax=Burkholderia plantarii TaxID=41899 RepID=A0A0B6RP95_BURPL|nr:hypothetical protein [Burkholderia plantarii]AJK47162.1 hypothetical protein BGL_1c26750 [Burkholderia plantarii]